jgi:ketosteroid isomerase-like protein
VSAAASVRTALEAFEGGDADALMRHVHPEVEVSDPERAGAGPFRGRDQFRAWTQDWMETWDEYEMALEALVTSAECVVALVRHRGRARGSGAPVDQQGAQLYRVRDGLIAFWRPFTDRAQALATAGLDGARWRAAIETLVTGYDAWNRRDFETLVGLQRNLEFVPVTQSPDMPVFSGRTGAEQFWTNLLETWETFAFTPLVFEPSGDQVLVDVAVSAKGRGSGIELEERWAHLFTLQDGELVRMQAFTSGDDARDALLS